MDQWDEQHQGIRVVFGSPSAQLCLILCRRSVPDADNSYDADEIESLILADVSGFHAIVPTVIGSHEVADLLELLSTLNTGIDARLPSQFRLAEGVLTPNFTFNDRGRLFMEVEVTDAISTVQLVLGSLSAHNTAIDTALSGHSLIFRGGVPALDR